jgi:hypothetical protein
MVTVCVHCGADLSNKIPTAVFGNADNRCPDCGLASDEQLLFLVPEEDEVLYDLTGWPPGDRITMGSALREQDVPYRWEPGPVLVVGGIDQPAVEQVLDDMESMDGEDEDRDAVDGEMPDGQGEEAEGEDDERAATVMGDLFDVADRLIRSPWNAQYLAEVADLGDVVDGARPPFGVDPAVWDRIGDLSAAVLEAAEEDEVAVEDAARTLRDFLREYV